MKKLLAISILGMLFLSAALPLAWAVGDPAVPGDVSGTPEEFADLEKTMKQDRMDNLERRIADLEQANRFLNQRVQDVERSVYDFKSRT